MKYVIIGNSAAGIGAAEGIRQIDKKGRITVVSSESCHTYSRPLISYLLLGKTDKERMRYRAPDFYEKNGVVLLSGKTVVKVRPKSVTLDDGTVLECDKLLVGTGSSPFVPPIDGLDNVKNKFTFMTLDDALSLQAALNKKSRVLIVGAGLIGLKCAEGISASVASVTVLDVAPHILSSILDAESAGLVQTHMEARGISFRLGEAAAGVTENSALLKSGGSIPFDALVLAAGVRPSVSLVKDAGGAVNRGILVNERMETSLPGVFAAGDCVESFDITIGQSRILALLPNAYMQGEVAGINMAGGDAAFGKAIPMNAIGFFGLHMATAGTYDGEVYCERNGGNYKKLFYKNDRLMGYIMIGDILRAGIYTNLIRERTPLGSLDFGLIRVNPGLLAFKAEDRRAKLAELQ